MIPTTHLGGTASNIEVAIIGHGLMLMTWGQPITDEQAFKAIKDGVDAAGGAKVILNSAEFYGLQLSAANLELLARFYTKYPEYADKTVLCVKGGLEPGTLTPNASEANMRRSINDINAKLRGVKRVDIYENARVDKTRPIEETIGIMKSLIQEGKFDHIGLSECNAETLKRANAVHPIASVEIEVSPWVYGEETKKVIATSAELNIPIQAYSPLGSGFMKIKTPEDLPEEDIRRHMERFRPENINHNLQLVERLKAIAEKLGISSAQLCLAWVRSLGLHMIPIPGSSKSSRTLENLAAGNITLPQEDCDEIHKLISVFEAKGVRHG